MQKEANRRPPQTRRSTRLPARRNARRRLTIQPRPLPTPARSNAAFGQFQRREAGPNGARKAVARYQSARPKSMNQVQTCSADPNVEANWQDAGLFSGGKATI